ncbi:SprB repeat-containing protein, partial [Putridiphycobacter roseus]
GTYTVTITDANGCTETASAMVTEPIELHVMEDVVTDATCFGNCDGTTNTIVTGGVAPFTYLWSNGETTAMAMNLCAGTHTVSVTDANGCFAIATVVVGGSSQINLITSSTDATCNTSIDGSVSVIATGGNGVFTYLWNDASGSTTATVNGLGAGTYMVTVTDSYGCMDSASVIVNEPTDLTANGTGSALSCHGDNDGTVTVIA